jgi:prophage lambdaSa2, HNH endonuclease family protein|nr:MAG TPA: homing endonuclease [Caudoviricetes sp.]
MVFIGYYYDEDQIIWKKIYWYDNTITKYSISNIGLVRNDKTDKILKTNFSKGYERIRLTHNGIVKQYFIHRLVAKAFIENPDNKPDVNHKDGVKHHNYDKNLEWVTASENIKHAFDNGLNYASSKKTLLGKKTVRYICKLLENNCHNISEIARIVGCSRTNVDNILRGRTYKKISKKYKLSNYTKRTIFSKSGDLSERTKYSDKDIHKVCELIDSGRYSLHEISEKTNISYQTIRNVYYGVCRKSVSSQYNFMKIKEHPLYEKKRKNVINACKLLDDGLNTREVSVELGVSRSFVRNILSGNTWKDISKDYSFIKK